MATTEILSEEEIRAIGARYGLRVSGTTGTTAGRLSVTLLFLALLFGVGLLVVGFVLAPFEANIFPYLHILALSAVAGLGLFFNQLLLINVPKMTGLITTNYFGGELHTFGPGLGLKYPWEHYSQGDFIDTRAISVDNTSRFTVPSGKSKRQTGGAVGVTFRWTVQYGPCLPLLAAYVRTEEKAIADGFKEVVENVLSEEMFSTALETLLKKETVDILQEKLERAFQGEDSSGGVIPGVRDVLGSSLQERFGIVVELSTLGPPDFDKDYKEALAARVLRSILTKDASTMAKDLGIPEERALRTIMILNKEDVKEQIFTLQADQQVVALAPVLMQALRAAGDAGINIGRRAKKT